MITLVLSSNMKKMLKDSVLVRKLVGIETAGSLNVLLTDKTGTLTTGTLKVTEFVSGDFKIIKDFKNLKKYPIYEIVYKSLFYNNASMISDNKIIGSNSTDRAILEYIDIDSNINVNIIKKEVFDSSKKYSSITLNDGTILIKGAMEVILPKCKNILNSNNKESKLFTTSIIKRKIDEYTKKSGRVLVFAYGKDINNLTFLGLSLIHI